MATTTKSKATTKRKTTSKAGDPVLEALKGLTGAIENINDRLDSVEKAQEVTAEAVTKAASGRRRHKVKDLVIEVASDSKGHSVAVVMYTDGGIRVRLGWTTKQGPQYRDIPLETYRLLVGHVDEVEETIAELLD